MKIHNRLNVFQYQDLGSAVARSIGILVLLTFLSSSTQAQGTLEPGLRVNVKDYYDFIALATHGSGYEKKDDRYQKLETEEIKTVRMLTRFSSSLSAAYKGVSASVSFSTEKEVTDYFRKLKQERESSSMTQSGTLKEDQVFGTLTRNARFKIGKEETNKVLHVETRVFSFDELKKRNNKPWTEDLANFATSNSILSQSQLPSKTIPINYVYQPKGKVCHHSKFLELRNDNCVPDGKNCIINDGNQAVVCHHHNYNWIGGANCNCFKIDGTNVKRVSYSALGYPR